MAETSTHMQRSDSIGMQNKGLTLWMSILAFLQTMTAGTNLAGFVGDKVSGFAALFTAGLMTATTAWIAAQSRVQPVKMEIPLHIETQHPANIATFTKEEKHHG